MFIIKFNIKYLKHNESMHFPTTLFFNEKVDTLEYEIKGENNPKIISGKLEKIKQLFYIIFIIKICELNITNKKDNIFLDCQKILKD